MALMRWSGAGSWTAPTTTAYTDEAALQKLLAESPDLLHGVSAETCLVARELSISGTGFLDIMVVDLDGSLTLVECKLRSNPEIRREIVGQILAYASALSAWAAHEFEAAWLSTTKRDLVTEAAECAQQSCTEFDPVEFRDLLTENLSAGRFRLVLAVDRVTPELRRIVEFLNQRSSADLEVLCIEFSYIADRDVEILVPTTYGVEAAERKALKIAQHTESDFRHAIAAHCEPAVVDAVTELLEHATSHNAFSHLYWGTGVEPSVTPWFHTEFGDIQPWSFYTGPNGKDVFGINYDWIHKRGKAMPDDAVARFRETVSKLPGVASAAPDARRESWARRPSLAAAPLFADPEAVRTLIAAVDEMLATRRV